MITAAEYRAWAEQCLKWAGEAATPQEREAHIKSAEIWIESALRGERLSKQPLPTTEYEWVLPPFQEWRRIGSRKGEGISINFRSRAKLLTKDEARRISANIAWIPEFLRR